MKYQKYNGDNMGLLVDTNKISSEIKNLDKYISDYNDNCADIYFELSKLNNMENKNSIISNLNGCISKLSVINNNFYNTYFPRDFYYINSLFSMERELITIKKDLNNYKDNINAIMEKINKNELEMASKLSKINELSISRFNS